LRRSPLGYRRADVDAALARRDAELTELRRDIAALWLALAEHDRMLRVLDTAPAPPAPPAPLSGDSAPAPDPTPPAAAEEATSIGAQLSELGDVLAAIEMATQTLESTYADELRGAAPGDAPDPDRSAPPAGDAEAGEAERPAS
jgi:hypothetical protein